MRILLALGLAAVLGFIWYQNQGSPNQPTTVQPTVESKAIPLPPVATVAHKPKTIRQKPVVKEQTSIEEVSQEEVEPTETVQAQEPVQEETQAQQQLPDALKFTPQERAADQPTEYILRSSELVRPEVVHPLITLTYGSGPNSSVRFEDRDVSTKKRSGFLANSDED